MNLILTITPTSGEFDVDEVRQWLDAQPDTFEDPRGTGVYAMCGMPGAADLAYRKRLEDGSRFPLAVLVTVAEREIRIDQEYANAATYRSALELVRWLSGRYAIAVGSPGGERDLDAEVREHGVEVLYPPDVRSAPLPSAGVLRGIGFFSDLEHGHSFTVSLEQARREQPDPDHERVARYLESGTLYRERQALARDPLELDDDAENPVIGPANLWTDGVYVWPGDLAYFVRTYHVRLPRHFLLHARANHWTVPEVDVAALPPLDGDVPDPIEGEHDTLWLEEPDIVLARVIRSGTGCQVREGYLRREPATRVLVTLTLGHAEPYPDLRRAYALDVEGIAAMRFLGAMPPDSMAFDDLLIEDLPAGRPAVGAGPMPEAAVLRLGAAVAQVLARAHARDMVVHGVSPELIYVDDQLGFTGLAPRGRPFIASARQELSGLGAYPVPYVSRDVLAGGAAGPASDVFALAATLHVLATGHHPFGPSDSIADLFQRVMRDERDPYPGSKPLGDVLGRAMAGDAATRPTAAELADQLAALAR